MQLFYSIPIYFTTMWTKVIYNRLYRVSNNDGGSLEVSEELENILK